MRKGSKKAKLKIQSRESGVAELYPVQEATPYFHQEKTHLLDRFFSRDPRLKGLTIRKRVHLESDPLHGIVAYESYELEMPHEKISEPEEARPNETQSPPDL